MPFLLNMETEPVDGSDEEDAAAEHSNAKAKKRGKKRQEREAQRQVREICLTRSSPKLSLGCFQFVVMHFSVFLAIIVMKFTCS